MGNVLIDRHPRMAAPQISFLGTIDLEKRVFFSIMTFLRLCYAFFFFYCLSDLQKKGTWSINCGKGDRMSLSWSCVTL